MKFLFRVAGAAPGQLRGRFCNQPTSEDAPAAPSQAAFLAAPAGVSPR